MNETSENLLQRAIEIWQTPMCRASLDGAIIEVNSAWSRFLGWSESELRSENFFELVHPDDLDRTRERVAHGKARAIPSVFENRYRHKDGTYRSLTWTAVADSSQLYACGRDVMAHKDAETALGRAEDTLRHLQKVDAISQLSSEIAHDFNNSLQNVVASLEIARRLISAGRTGETDRFMASAIDAVRTAAAVNQRVLGLSRRRPRAPKVLRLNELITGMEDLLRRALPRSIKLEVKLPPDLWQTFCDADEAETALLNLILNARDAITGDGLIAIETSNVHRDPLATASAVKMAQREMPQDQVTQNELAPLAFVCVEVTDSGTGMGGDGAERAFDAFYSTKAPGRGLGLGLTVVDEFARRYGGCATIKSEIGGGTCVGFYLPRHRDESSG